MDLTIIVPTRNRNTTLAECVCALDHNDAEIIVVDDASEEPVVLTPAANVRIIRHDRQYGRSTSINTGLKAASHNAVLIVNDDIYAAPDMVFRLFREFLNGQNPKTGLKARVLWDPDIPLTPTMKWMEQAGKFQMPVLCWRPFLFEHGGYDDNFAQLEDVELDLRLKQHGFEMRRQENAIAFQHNVVKIRDLIEREFTNGIAAVAVQAKFPHFLSQTTGMDALLKNESLAGEIEAAVEQISLTEDAGGCEIPEGRSELFSHICRYYFLHGFLAGIKDMGGLKQRSNRSAASVIYKQAVHLENTGDLDEARRLFRLVLHRPEQDYWNGAEYHLGCIESSLGNSAAARIHFSECLRLNPAHGQARRALNHPEHYCEVESNIFEITGNPGPAKELIVVLGDEQNVVYAISVVEAMREQFQISPALLTTREYAGLARAVLTGDVFETKPSETIPWNWIRAQEFTRVYFPESGGHLDDSEWNGFHPLEFIARKCGVQIGRRRSELKPHPAAIFEAAEFLQRHRLRKKGFITAWQGNGEGRHWPNSNLMMLARHMNAGTVVFGKAGDPPIPGTIPCLDPAPEIIAVLIEWSCFYLGPEYGLSWLATMTDTPMAIFHDPSNPRPHLFRFQGAVQEWNIYTKFQTVLDEIESTILISAPH